MGHRCHAANDHERGNVTNPNFIVNSAVVNRTDAMDSNLIVYFDHSGTYQTGSSLAPCIPNANLTPVFQDETQLESAINNGNLPAGAQAVMYDCEKWSLTPYNQQQHPGYWYQRAANAAHAAGLLLIAAPGTNLADVVNPGTGPQWQRFLSAYIAKTLGQYVDVYDLQAQSLEADVGSYESYVQEASRQVLAGNPNAVVLSGLSTNPNGNVQPASALLAAAQAVQDYVTGWWINDPASGPQCPNCSGPYPQTVVDFLNGLSGIGY